MLVQFLLLLPLSLSSGKFIQTKHMQGGVFGWPNALLAQRHLWASLPIPVKFYKSDVKLTKIFDPLFAEMLKNISVNEMIEDAINNLTSSKDDKNEEEISQFKIQAIFRDFHEKLLLNQNKKLLEYGDDIDYDNDNNNDNDNNWYQKCKNTDLKNLKLLDQMGMLESMDFFKNNTCEEIDELFGQLFSFALIIVPIVVMWLIITLFYIFYCCGCCCCCRAKDRYNPGIVSIVFYALIGGLLVIALIFNILSAVYLYNVISYVLDGQAFDDVNYSLDFVKPSINSMTKDFQGNLTDALKTTNDKISDSVDDGIVSLKGLITSTLDNFTSLKDLFKSIKDINETNIKPSLESNNDFAKCYGTITDQDKICAGIVDKASEALSQIDISGISDIIENLGSVEDIINEVKGTLDSTLKLDDYKGDIMKVIDDLTGSINDFNITEMIDEFNISDIQKEVTNVKKDIKDFDPISKFYPAFKAAPFIFPFFLLILTALELMAFWLKNCCSRCIVCCCCCRCCCTSCLALFGMFCTFVAIPLIVIDIFYDQGDGLIESAMKNVINENLTIIFPNISIGDQAGGMVEDIHIEPFRLNKPVLVKKFVDAKLDTTLTEWISITDLLSFRNLADMINKTISEVSVNKSKISGIASDAITGADDFVNDEFFDDLPLGDVTDAIKNVTESDTSGDIDKQCKDTTGYQCPTKFKSTLNQYTYLFENLTYQSGRAKDVIGETKGIINSMPTEITNTVTKLIDNLLGSLGGPIANVINVIEPSLSGTKVDWAISVFNIIRVKACYNILGAAMAFSISAHLFIVGFAAMTILLCVRRKGMGKVAKERELSYSYSYEYSYSGKGEEEDKKDKKKKKKTTRGKNKHVDSDEENTSDGVGLVEFRDDMGDDVEKRDISDEKDSDDDEISNYNNPYQHDESTTNQFNDDDDDDESTIRINESSVRQGISEVDSEPGLSFNEDESTNNKSVTVDDDDDNKVTESENDNVSENEVTESETTNNNNNNNNFPSPDNSSDNNSEIDDEDQQTYVI